MNKKLSEIRTKLYRHKFSYHPTSAGLLQLLYNAQIYNFRVRHQWQIVLKYPTIFNTRNRY